jgi:serine/threonine-protein kinase
MSDSPGGGGGSTGGSDTVKVVADDYVGQPEDTATQQLGDLGLDTAVERRTNPGGEAAGTVAAVHPTGRVQRGSTVTLEVWDEATAKPAKGDTKGPGKDQGKDHGKTPGKGKGKHGGPLDGQPGGG